MKYAKARAPSGWLLPCIRMGGWWLLDRRRDVLVCLESVVHPSPMRRSIDLSYSNANGSRRCARSSASSPCVGRVRSADSDAEAAAQRSMSTPARKCVQSSRSASRTSAGYTASHTAASQFAIRRRAGEAVRGKGI